MRRNPRRNAPYAPAPGARDSQNFSPAQAGAVATAKPKDRTMKLTCILIMFISMAAHADDELNSRLEDIEGAIMFQAALSVTGTTSGPPQPAARDDRPEWQRTGCRTHPDVIDGMPLSVCDRDTAGNIIPGNGQ